MLEIQRRPEHEKTKKQKLAVKGEPHPVAEERMEKREGRLAELDGFGATNGIDFKTIPSTKGLLYLAWFVLLDAIYGDGKGRIYGPAVGAAHPEFLKGQFGEIGAEIARTERATEKGRADKRTRAGTQREGH